MNCPWLLLVLPHGQSDELLELGLGYDLGELDGWTTCGDQASNNLWDANIGF